MNEGNTNVTAPVQGAGPVKKFNLGILIIPAIVVVLLIVGIVAKVATSTPKAVFTSSINSVYKDVSKYLKKADKLNETFDIKEKALYVKGDVKLSTNVEDITDEIGELKDLKVSFEGGLDLKHEELLGGFTVDGDKESIGGTVYVTDSMAYLKTTFLDEIYKTELDDFDLGEVLEEYEEATKDIDVDPETYDYLVKTVKNAVVKSLDKKSMEKSKGSFEVDGKTVKATKVSYVFTKSSTKELINKVVDILLEDDKFIDKLADCTGMEKGDIKDALKEVKSSAKDIDFDKEIKLNLYTKGLFNNVVGMSLEYSDKEYVTVFKNGKTTEMIFDNHVKSDQMKVVVTAVEGKKETEVTIKMNKEKLGTLTIRELSEEVIDLDFNVEAAGEKVKGTIYFTEKQKKNVISGEYKFKLSRDEEYVELSGNYSIEAQDKLEGFKTSDAVSFEDADEEAIADKLKEVIEKDEKLNAIFSDLLEELEPEPEPEPYYDSNSMVLIYLDSEFTKLFADNNAKVLYVGDSYYSIYDEKEADARALLDNIVAAQTKYKFHSYRYPNYYLSDEQIQQLGETKTCEEDYDCDKYPALYFIKDKEVKKVLRGKVSAEDIATALQEIELAE